MPATLMVKTVPIGYASPTRMKIEASTSLNDLRQIDIIKIYNKKNVNH